MIRSSTLTRWAGAMIWVRSLALSPFTLTRPAMMAAAHSRREPIPEATKYLTRLKAVDSFAWFVTVIESSWGLRLIQQVRR